MESELSLLYPEWQSYGENAAVHAGALKVAQLLFNRTDFLCVTVPSEENFAADQRGARTSFNCTAIFENS